MTYVSRSRGFMSPPRAASPLAIIAFASDKSLATDKPIRRRVKPSEHIVAQSESKKNVVAACR
jgi:hypothetical protein